MDARGYDQVKKSSHIYLNNEESLFSSNNVSFSRPRSTARKPPDTDT